MKKYSLVVLFEESESKERVVALQKYLSEAFGGESALQLPLHITLLKWRADRKPGTKIVETFHDRPCRFLVDLESIEISKNKRSLWYKIRSSNVLSEKADIARAFLIEDGIDENSMRKYDRLHVTLAYKDYGREEIIQIRNRLKDLRIEGQLAMFTDRTMLCTTSVEGEWILWPEGLSGGFHAQ